MQRKWLKRLPFTRGELIAIGAICLFFIAVLFFGPTLLERCLKPNDPNSAVWLYWLLLISGNWDAARKIVTPWTYAFTAICAVLLNNLLLIAVPGLIWKIFVEWRARMRLKQAFLTRDEMLYQSVISKFSSNGDIDEAIEAKIEAGFREGIDLWQKHVIAIFGEEEAHRLFRSIESNEPVS